MAVNTWIIKLRSEIIAAIAVLNFIMLFIMSLNQLGVFGFATRISVVEAKVEINTQQLVGLDKKVGELDKLFDTYIQAHVADYSRMFGEHVRINARLDQLMDAVKTHQP